jgi:enoyl-CoA hydratase
MGLIRVDYDGPLATLTLDRPEARNALSVDLCNAIASSLGEIEQNDQVRAVALRGEGPAFCAGADYAAVSGPGGLEFLTAFEAMLESVARFPLPVVAVIQGAALGAGLQLATACDLRIAAESAKIGIPSSRLGIVVNFENVQRLVLMAGIPVTKELLMTGRVYSGSEALAAGLVSRVAPDENLDVQASDFVASLTSGAPLSVRGAKLAIQAIADDMAAARLRNSEAVDEIDRLVMEAYNSDDLAEGFSALSEKRTPRFKGR